LNAADYGIWTTADASGKNGYQRFQSEMKASAEYCLNMRGASRASVYGCGGLFQPKCPDDLYSQCITSCMTKDPISADFATKVSVPYTKPCAFCMAKLQNCTLDVCLTKCVNADSVACHSCAETNCGEAFRTCGGLNAVIPSHEEHVDPTIPIIAGVVGGVIGVGAITAGIYMAFCRAKSAMTQADLARLAAGQGMPIQGSPFQGQGGGPGNMSRNPQYGYPGQSGGAPGGSYGQQQQQQQQYPGGSYGKPGGSFENAPQQQLTPYQQQYEAQQRAIQMGQDPRVMSGNMAPSARMSAMAQQNPSTFENRQMIRLVALYAFVGERADELTVNAGDRLFGIEEQDSWWLAKTEKGIIGLIPSNYCEMENGGGGALPGNTKGDDNVSPDF
jgi:hypothetical protein